MTPRARRDTRRRRLGWAEDDYPTWGAMLRDLLRPATALIIVLVLVGSAAAVAVMVTGLVWLLRVFEG